MGYWFVVNDSVWSKAVLKLNQVVLCAILPRRSVSTWASNIVWNTLATLWQVSSVLLPLFQLVMTLRGEILQHLGKEELKYTLENPSLVNLLKLTRAFSFIIFLFMYWFIFQLASLSLIALKITIPSTKSWYDHQFNTGFWLLCIYFLVCTV